MTEQKHPLTVLIDQSKVAIREALQGAPIELGEFLVGLKSAVAKDKESGSGQLLACIEKNPSSVIQRLVEAAQLGLSPAPVKQHFHLVPRKIKGSLVCTSVIGFRGLCDLAHRSGEVEHVGAELVFKGQNFEINPVDGAISHKRDPFADHSEPELIGAYAWCKLKGSGSTLSRVMSKKDLDQRRASAKTDMMWGPWWKEMYRKTVLRALLNSGMVPLGEPARLHLEASSEEEEIRSVEATVIEPESQPVPEYEPHED